MEEVEETPPSLPPRKRAPSRALAELRLNTLLAVERTNSSGDEDQECPEEEMDEAQSAIGVSIGKQQTRLLSPRTPAVEKAAAIDHDGGFFRNFSEVSRTATVDKTLLEEDDEDVDQESWKDSPESEPSTTAPSPGRLEPRENDALRPPRSSLRGALGLTRQRASSDVRAEDGAQPRLSRWTNIPIIGKHMPFASSRDNIQQDQPLSRIESSTSTQERPSNAYTAELATSPTVFSPDVDTLTQTKELEAAMSRLPSNRSVQQVLRRTNSDSSLMLQRTFSRVSSLGDDTRWQGVHEQVNSRFKAFKDSFQDSSIKLPSISSITPDFWRERSNSSGLKSTDGMRGNKKPMDPMTRQPYRSAKFALNDAPIDKHALTHPQFAKALDQLEGDLVIMGGYRGSILRSAEPPHRQLWVPIKVGLNLRKVDLEVGLRDEDDALSTATIIPDGMLTHIGPVDVSRRLFKRLRNCDNAKSGKLRVHDYGYDWRLHPLHLSKLLVAFLEKLPCNQPTTPQEQRGATVIAHSLGGLITRHAVNQRPELFRGVVYAGVPKTCVNILGPLRNGDDVLLSSRVLTAQVNFSIRTSFALLPLNGRCFFDTNTKEEYRVDFFDPQTWLEHRLSPCIARPLPPLAGLGKSTGLTSYVSSVASALPSLHLPGRRATLSRSRSPAPKTAAVAGGVAEPDMAHSDQKESDIAIAHGNVDHSDTQQSQSQSAEDAAPPSVRTAVTIPFVDAMEYLTRTLRTVKKFKQELAFDPAHYHANVYPPIAAIYGKSTPTVFGARVNGREAIKHADAYDDLAFASGDGVVLARAAMVPVGYQTARGGLVSSDRGHVTLLGDLEAVGKCLNAVIDDRKKGVGRGDS